MSILATTQSILNWGRFYIPDPKTRTKAVRNEEVGRTSLPSISREVFYIKQQAIGSVFLYIDPYKFSACSSLSAAATSAKVFVFNATLQSCTLSKTSDPGVTPAQFKPVYTSYEYTENLPYCYSDLELLGFLPAAISYLNNKYVQSYTYTGTTSTFTVSFADDDEKAIVALALAVVVRRSYVTEQMRRGLGVSFKGQAAAINSREQLVQYTKDTALLEDTIKISIYEAGHQISNLGQSIDTYSEDIVTS
uniref:Uncharacterized protein n=1 Tax=viral metagenome TaxID=1070528 RepID=A0A6M3IIR8_9ZZZZ